MNSRVYLPNSQQCFVCGEANPAGLRSRFFVEEGYVKLPLTAREVHGGYPGTVHGGVTAAAMDECMGWAASRALGRMCVTGELTVKYLKRIPIGAELTVWAEVVKAHRLMARTAARLLDAEGVEYARAEGKFTPLSAAETLEVDGTLTYRGGEERVFDALRMECGCAEALPSKRGAAWFQRVLLSGMRRVLAPDAAPEEGAAYDAVLTEGEDLAAMLAHVRSWMGPFGAGYVVVEADTAAEVVPKAVSEAGLLLYALWTVRGDDSLAFVGPGTFTEGEGPWLLMLVHERYDPVQHARGLLRQGHTEWALEVLENVPERLLTDDLSRGVVAAERQICLLAWDQAAGESGRLNRFAKEQDIFYIASTWAPQWHQAYQSHALFWQRIGRNDMARRLLRSVAHAAPDSGTERVLRTIPRFDAFSPRVEEAAEASPEYRPRMLCVFHPLSDFGADVLFDGLCEVLGEDRVVDFPRKKTLHCRPEESGTVYPCVFDRATREYDFEGIAAELRAGRFDWILFCDTLKLLDGELARAIFAAAGDTPVAILDTWDQCGDYFGETEAFCGAANVRVRFKREMLDGAAYSERTVPLPFGYDVKQAPREVNFEGRSGLFWIGSVQYGARRQKLEWLGQRIGLDFTRKCGQEQYRRELLGAAAGLSLFGNGFDTVRYWELPAHGCMLVAERPPIRIPHNFTNGVNAVFFDDLPELEDVLAHYLARPEEMRRIAEAGYAHFLRYHTSRARALQMLGALERAGR